MLRPCVQTPVLPKKKKKEWGEGRMKENDKEDEFS
jgi:hypothetical protein